MDIQQYKCLELDFIQKKIHLMIKKKVVKKNHLVAAKNFRNLLVKQKKYNK